MTTWNNSVITQAGTISSVKRNRWCFGISLKATVAASCRYVLFCVQAWEETCHKIHPYVSHRCKRTSYRHSTLCELGASHDLLSPNQHQSLLIWRTIWIQQQITNCVAGHACVKTAGWQASPVTVICRDRWRLKRAKIALMRHKTRHKL